MDSMMVGYDGLAPSRVALDWVAARAAQRPSRVELVTVVAGDVFAEDGPSVAVDGAERRLRNVAPNVEVTSERVAGKMPDALLRAANRADLLVIGAHRRRPLQSALTGWRPLRVISRSRVPVVVVPEEWEPADGPVLVGVDDDDSSAAAAEYAAAEAVRLGVGLTVLHAWRMPQPTMDGAVAYFGSPIAPDRDLVHGVLLRCVPVACESLRCRRRQRIHLEGDASRPGGLVRSLRVPMVARSDRSRAGGVPGGIHGYRNGRPGVSFRSSGVNFSPPL